MKKPRMATMTFTIPLPDFCGGAGALAAAAPAGVDAIRVVEPPALAAKAIPSTAIPHFAQNFVPAANGLPQPTQNFFSGSTTATHFVPHEEQNACVSASDAPQALHVFAISIPFPRIELSLRHFFVTVPS